MLFVVFQLPRYSLSTWFASSGGYSDRHEIFNVVSAPGIVMCGDRDDDDGVVW